jgi:hypothetical protein
MLMCTQAFPQCARRTQMTVGLLATAWFGAPQVAHAGGVEDTVSGTVALGRAANYARVNDFMATWQNPANLAIAPRQVGAELRVPFFNACFDRARDNRTTTPGGTPLDQDNNGTPGIQYRPEENFDEVCNEAPLLPAGNLGFAMPVGEKWGIGVGFFTPAGVGNLKFGDDNQPTVFPQPDEMYETTTGGDLSPNRFLLLDRTILAGFLSLGVGYAPLRMLRVGASLSAGFADVKYRNFASLGPGFQDQEILNDVNASDYFVPRATVSAVLTPIDAIEVMGSLTWNDDISAKGQVDITANGIQGAPRKSCYHRTADPMTGSDRASPGPHCRVDDIELSVPYQRFEAVLGIRYSDRKVPREQVLDPMQQETWDVELDAYWVHTGHVDNYTLKLFDPTTPSEEWPFVAFSTAPDQDNASSLPSKATLPHGWRDTYGARLGGDYNVLPEVLALRAGIAYETRGVPIKNMNLDYWPVQKTALHLGATWRIGPVDLSVAYAHIFNETIDVAVGQGNVKEVTAVYRERALAANEGTYRSSIDIVSLQGNYRF